MDYMQRQKRVRQLVKKVNRQRKKQAKKIDILCNDLIGAHRDFINKLDTIRFASHFYESIVGISELSGLFYAAGKLIKEEIADANVVFLLRRPDNFELHMQEEDEPITLGAQNLENCFTAELVNDVCRANKVCGLDDLFAMGLNGNPTWLNKISAVTIPLGEPAVSVGFILLYRTSGKKITDKEICHISAITGGLSKAITSCQVISSASD